jgi:hypothetical protein
MGSAPLKYGPDGEVAWDEVWTTFCDLAIAGGPPHRGTLLEPVPAATASAEPERYAKVVREIHRGIRLTAGLRAARVSEPGWAGLECPRADMARWLVRAIVAENVSARHDGEVLYLPAGPQFRVEKEIKNVVTAVAKVCHYWTDHFTADQRAAVATFGGGDDGGGSTLFGPASPEAVRAAPAEYDAAALETECEVQSGAGLRPGARAYGGWVGFDCGDEAAAVWLLRGVVVEDVLARREGSVLFLPVDPNTGDEGRRKVVGAMARACRCWRLQLAREHLRSE